MTALHLSKGRQLATSGAFLSRSPPLIYAPTCGSLPQKRSARTRPHTLPTCRSSSCKRSAPTLPHPFSSKIVSPTRTSCHTTATSSQSYLPSASVPLTATTPLLALPTPLSTHYTPNSATFEQGPNSTTTHFFMQPQLLPQYPLLLRGTICACTNRPPRPPLRSPQSTGRAASRCVCVCESVDVGACDGEDGGGFGYGCGCGCVMNCEVLE
jgi:hypothetical protein